ncbi:YoaK family protein [Compostimonas suwonensis]|uniref:Uncharacterized membrane protein YoaK (UPF0700 family) n=1 Tax=Compostimonas suwonensis TaxID=1048394 RepID=A0A2M9BVI9_9MICO|nr:YoaK family protein [Compostimonas suwonensis]PJJ61960.1 uncharacterized membrane protein YoaK (UPF0700 family) [Compostimonas suwonensis]
MDQALAVKPPERLHLTLMLALTFSTGLVDAVGYLGLDRVFTGNMTGNVVILGMGLLGADDLPVVGPVIALLCFMLGATVAGRVLRPIAAGWTIHSTWLFTAVAAIILALTVMTAVVGDMPQTLQYIVTGALGFAMGMQAGTARHIAVKDVTTVVVTSTLTGLAADSVLGGDKKQPWRRRAAAVLLIGLGALCGAAALHVHIALGLGIAAAITLTVAVVGHVRRDTVDDADDASPTAPDTAPPTAP